MRTINTDHFEIDCKGALTELSITQKQFAIFMGVTEQAVCGWVKNKTFPTYAVAWLKLQIEANTIITCEKQRGKDALKRHQDSVISERDYFNNVEGIAGQVWELALKKYEEDNGEKATDNDGIIDIISYYGLDHESVDQDEWMIYTRFHSAICEHTNNVEAYEGLGCDLSGDFATITQTVAFYAMLQDVQDALQSRDL